MKEGTAQTNLSRFLFNYRITPHSSTGMLPAELLFGRRLNSHLDNLKPNENSAESEKTERRLYVHARAREFQVGDKVFVWNYRGRSIWLAGIVTGKEGRMVYVVQTQSGDSIRRHIDQMRVRVGESVNMGEDQDRRYQPILEETVTKI